MTTYQAKTHIPDSAIVGATLINSGVEVLAAPLNLSHSNKDVTLASVPKITPMVNTTNNTTVIKKDKSYIVHAKTRYTPNFYFYEGDTIIGQSIRMYGEYTETEIDLLKHFMNEHSTVFDIGANIGYHTVAFAHHAKQVFAFEPNNKNYTLLEKNTASLPSVRLFHAACSDVVGDAFISDYDVNSQGNFGECMMAEEGQPCKTVRIDDLDLPMPDIIKIDVEGHELKVFNGSRETIKRSRPVIFYEAMHGEGFDIIHDFLVTELDYRIYYCPAPNFNPNNYNGVQRNIFGTGGVMNCIAIPSYMGKLQNFPEMINRDDTFTIAVERLVKQLNEV